MKVILKIIIKYWYWIYLVVNWIYLVLKKNDGMKRRGIFSRKQEEFITTVIAEKVKPKNGLYRWLIKKGLFLIIRSVDNFGLDRIAENWKLRLIPIVDYGMEGDIENVRKHTAKLLDKQIDIKWMDETEEEKWFDSLTMLLTLSIESYINYRRES
jgi:hypothetical protein